MGMGSMGLLSKKGWINGGLLSVAIAFLVISFSGCDETRKPEPVSDSLEVMTKDNVQLSLTLGEKDTECFIEIASVLPCEIENLYLDLYFSAYDPQTQEFFYERYTSSLASLSSSPARIPLTDFVQASYQKYGIQGGSRLYYIKYTSLCKIVIHQVGAFINGGLEYCDIKARLEWILCPGGPDEEYRNSRLGTWSFPQGYDS
jgi:hypothetical protein